MSLRRYVATSFASALSLGILAVPALASATTTTASVTSGGAAPVLPAAPLVTTSAGVLSAPTSTLLSVPNPVASASAGGITLFSRATAMLRQASHVTGTAPAGETVTVQRQDPTLGWVSVVTTVADSDGSFDANWKPTVLGTVALRAVAGIPAVAASAASTPSGPAPSTVSTTVYRPGVATWFSVDDNGSQTACGVKLTRTTLGVAHRTLPCGTEVALYYHGRAIVVPVIDRGPYASGVTWDLTRATNDELHGNGRITVGSLQVPATPATTTTPSSVAASATHR